MIWEMKRREPGDINSAWSVLGVAPTNYIQLLPSIPELGWHFSICPHTHTPYPLSYLCGGGLLHLAGCLLGC